MAKSLGLMIQSEWVEMSCPDDRFFLRLRKSRQEWKSQLAQIVKERNITHLRIASSNPELSILKGQAQPPVLLFTSGFENWLTLQNHSHGYGLREVIDMSSDSDRIFAVNERTQSSGEILREVQLKDLEHLKAKLDLQSQKTVCVCFLHSNLNSSNEDKVAHYLRESGYVVHTSSQWPDLSDEIIRWSHTLVNAMATQIIQEDVRAIETEIKQLNLAVAVEVWTASGLHSINTISEAMGFERSIENFIENHESYENILHLGIEQFHWASLDSQGSGLALPLPMHPYSPLIRSLWGLPLTQKQAPLITPMSLTVSVRPTLFDILTLEEPKILGLESEQTEKLVKRIQSTLFSMTRSEFVKPREMQNLHRSLIKMSALEMIHFVIKNKNSDSILLTGAFAPLYLEQLKELAPSIHWKLASEFEYAESLMTLEAIHEQ